MPPRQSTTMTLDGAAVALSFGCIVHCLGLPILAALLPVLAEAGELEWVHKAFVITALPISFLAIRRTAGAQGGVLVWVGILAGISLLVLGAFVEALHDFETPLTIAGAMVLAGSHIVRWRLHRAAR